MYLGDFAANAVVNFAFTTHSGAGAAVAPVSAFEAADLKIYKGNSTTERSSSAGVTMTSPFDAIIGLHHVSIDTSNNTDAGFWAAGNDYIVVLSPDETVDGQAVVRVVGQFSVENRNIIADAVWDEVLSGHVGAGSAGKALSDMLSSGVLLKDGAISSSTFEVDAIDANALAPDAVADIQSGLATASALAIVDDFLDTEVAAIKAKTDNLPASPAAEGSAMTLATEAIDADALAANAVDKILDEVVEGSLTMRQVLRLTLAALTGKAAGGGTTTITFRDNADSKNRISATVDASGNRTAVTLDGS